MYEREYGFPSGRRQVPRRGRRARSRRLPLAMLALSLVSFALAIALGAPDKAPSGPSPQQPRSLHALALSRGEEPVLPGAAAPEKAGVSGAAAPEKAGASGAAAGKAASGAGTLAAPEKAGTPAADSWSLTLVNPWTPVPEDYDLALAQLPNGHAVDQRCYEDLQAMLDTCREAGLSPVISSSYRTQQKQEQLFQNKVDRLTAQGLSPADARTEAARSVAVPGTSEHQLGLAVDIVDLGNQNLDSSQQTTPVQVWLMEHCWEYGFILRYPEGKSDLTGIIFEPWHYRYVGREAAGEIRDQGVCLEEYLEGLSA